MPDTGDAISVSLEDIALRIRAIMGRRTEFPTPTEVARTEGPAGGASQEFRASLNAASQQIARLTGVLAVQLSELEQALAATGRELVAADEGVAGDMGALEWILGSVDEPVPAPSPAASPATPSGATVFE
jgi:uncharacterized protein (DUF2342 family)